MTVSKALKEKNRIAGRVSKLESQFLSLNLQKEGTDFGFDRAEIFKTLEKERADLVDLKIRIAKANAGIAEKLVELAEAKAWLVYTQSIGARAGVSREERSVQIYVNGVIGTGVEVYTSHISKKQASELEEEAQKRIDRLQDEIDNFNGTTTV